MMAFCCFSWYAGDQTSMQTISYWQEAQKYESSGEKKQVGEPRAWSRCSFPITCLWMIGMQGVYALPTVWPDVSMMGANNLRRVVGYDFHHIRKKYDAPSMWDNIRPRWRLLQQHLETKGPGWYSLAEREERLFTNRSNRPGDDMKDELRTNSDPSAWSTWRTSQNQLWQLRQPASPLEFPGEQGMLTNMLCPGSRERTSHIAAVHW